MRTIQSEVIEKGLKQVDRDDLGMGKQNETFSLRELEDLMGKNRDTYKRVRGSVKRRQVDL